MVDGDWQRTSRDSSVQARMNWTVGGNDSVAWVDYGTPVDTYPITTNQCKAETGASACIETCAVLLTGTQWWPDTSASVEPVKQPVRDPAVPCYPIGVGRTEAAQQPYSPSSRPDYSPATVGADQLGTYGAKYLPWYSYGSSSVAAYACRDHT